MLERAGVTTEATASRFFSADGVYTESLTLAERSAPNIPRGGQDAPRQRHQRPRWPVRLYVAPMYGYKSIKWLNRIESRTRSSTATWEDEGYLADAWIGGSAPAERRARSPERPGPRNGLSRRQQARLSPRLVAPGGELCPAGAVDVGSVLGPACRPRSPRVGGDLGELGSLFGTMEQRHGRLSFPRLRPTIN